MAATPEEWTSPENPPPPSAPKEPGKSDPPANDANQSVQADGSAEGEWKSPENPSPPSDRDPND